MTDESDDLKVAIEHERAWYALHAGQRMQVINFFVLSISFLTTAYVTAATKDLWEVSLVVGLFGVLISTGLHLLDRRTRRLIDLSREVLAVLEARALQAAGVAMSPVISQAKRDTRPVTYGAAISFLSLGAGAIFLLGAAYSISKMMH